MSVILCSVTLYSILTASGTVRVANVHRTDDGCGERETRIIWSMGLPKEIEALTTQHITRYSSYLEDCWPCAGGVSVVNAIIGTVRVANVHRTYDGCGKRETRIIWSMGLSEEIEALTTQHSTRYRSYVEDCWPCAGAVSVGERHHRYAFAWPDQLGTDLTLYDTLDRYISLL